MASYEEEEAKDIAESGETNANVYGMSEELVSYFTINEGTFDPERFQEGGYALLIESDEEGWLKPGDVITVSDYEEDGRKAKEKELTVMALADMPYGISCKRYPILGVEVVMSEQDFHQLFSVKGALHACIEAEEGKEKAVAEGVRELLETAYPDLSIRTMETLEKEFASNTSMFSAIGGFLAFILGLIGILNLINSMITGILARKQEFAMMQAVGMTGKQLEKMLIMEGIWYGLWTLLITATIGNVISYGFVYMMGKNMQYFVWSFRFLPLLVSIPVILLISVLLPVFCYHGLCKKSIVERLRLTEV